MLVLTRRLGEEIVIGDTICVKIVGVDGCQVRIGVQAPREVAIFRREVYARRQAEEDEAGGPTPEPCG